MGGLAKLSGRMCSEHLHGKSSESGWVDLQKFQVAWSLCCTNVFQDVCSEHLHGKNSESGWVDLQKFRGVCSRLEMKISHGGRSKSFLTKSDRIHCVFFVTGCQGPDKV